MEMARMTFPLGTRVFHKVTKRVGTITATLLMIGGSRGFAKEVTWDGARYPMAVPIDDLRRPSPLEELASVAE